MMAQPDDDKPLNLTDRTASYLRRFTVKMPNIRLWSFLLSVALVVLCLLVPILFGPTAFHSGWTSRAGRTEADGRWSGQWIHPASFWTVGEMSKGHVAFGGDCSACHESAFVRVRSSACQSCHTQTGPHADPHRTPMTDMSAERCESCHIEHMGQAIATRNDPAGCIECHRDLKKVAPETTLKNVTDFAGGHPNFAPALVADAKSGGLKRFAMDDPKAEDHGNLRFTHMTHVKLPAIQKRGAEQGGTCALCHQPAPGGTGFKPVSFDRDCASCHTLQFEPRHPEWRLPHGHPDEVASRIAGFYAGAALAGEKFEAPRSDLFARPGAPPPAPAPTGAAMVSSQTAAAMMSSIARSACGQCHVTTPPASGAPATAWTVEPVLVPDHFLTKAAFRHDKHETTPCQTCHAAETSNGGPLQTLPGIEVCRGCHSGNEPAPQRVTTSCVTCHSFHTPLKREAEGKS